MNSSKDNSIYLAGGIDGRNCQNTIIAYNIGSSNYFELLNGKMSVPKYFMVGQIYGRKLLAVGGKILGKRTNSVAIYHIDAKTWDTANDMQPWKLIPFNFSESLVALDMSLPVMYLHDRQHDSWEIAVNQKGEMVNSQNHCITSWQDTKGLPCLSKECNVSWEKNFYFYLVPWATILALLIVSAT